MPEMPARYYVGVAAARDRVFVIGGWRQGAGDARVSAFDVKQGQWVAVASLPTVYKMPNVAAVGDRLFVVGARENSQTLEYDFAGDTWQPRALMPPARGHGAAAVGVSGTQVLVAGGVIDGMSDNNIPSGRRQVGAYAYDTVRDQWETLPPLPEAVGYNMGGVIGKKFYVMGGSTNQTRTPDTFVFDLDSRVWTRIDPLPRDLSSAGAVVLRGRIVLVAGLATSVGMISPDTQVLDPATDTWSTVAPIPTPRFGLGAAVLDDRLYVAGGVVQAPGDMTFPPTPVLEVFIP